jgi:Domain of unknown function (DUF4345)
MSTTLATIGIGIAALMYFALGVTALAMPMRLLRGVGITVVGRAGRNEIRAVYGGFPLAVAGLLCASFAMPTVANGMLLALAVATLGMAVGRIISALLDRGIGKLPMVFAVMEMVVAGLIAAPIYLAPTLAKGCS